MSDIPSDSEQAMDNYLYEFFKEKVSFEIRCFQFLILFLRMLWLNITMNTMNFLE